MTFIAEQLDLPAEALADYASREQTMTDHARELATALGLRGATRTDVPFMIDAAAKAAWATDRGAVIAVGVIDALREARILVPSVSTVERAGIAGRARARKQAAHALLSGLRPEQLDALEALLITEPEKGITTLTRLKAIPTAVKPTTFATFSTACTRSKRSEFRQVSALPCIPTGTGSSSARGVRPLLT